MKAINRFKARDNQSPLNPRDVSPNPIAVKALCKSLPLSLWKRKYLETPIKSRTYQETTNLK